MTDNIDYGAVFGVSEELKEAEGVQAQEPADPAENTEIAQGVKEQESAAPAADNDTDSQAQTQENDDAEGQSTEGKPAQTPEERAQYAAARRKAEQERDAAIAQIRQQAQQEVDAAIAALGLTNPYTKQPINTKAEFDAFKARRQEEQKGKVLAKAGMSQEEFTQFVQGLPEVQQAAQAKIRAETALQKMRSDAAKSRMDAQLQEIRGMDPNIHGMEDLVKMETYPELLKKVREGYQLVDAYKLVNWDKLQQQNVDKAKQAARNAAAGKSHLQQTGVRGTGAVSVPESVKAEYRSFIPDATDDEIQKHWAAYQKSLKK